MRRWTEREDRIIRENASQGVRMCVRQLREEGFRRSASAVQHRASRMNVSLFRHFACPMCGREVRELTQKGYCPICSARESAVPARKQQAALMEKTRFTKEDEDELIRARRDAVARRQRKHVESRA